MSIKEPIKRDHKIYMYTNKINGKVYIGRTCQPLETRAGVNGRNYKGCKYFYNAIQKYGWNNFDVIILEGYLTSNEASEREIYWINKYNSSDDKYGYNIINKVHFDYTDKFRLDNKVRMSCRVGDKNSFYGKHHTEETKNYFRMLFKGKHPTEETCRKMSESRKGKYMGENNPMFGKHHTKETRKKMSESRKGHIGYMLGKHHTEESKKKIGDKIRGKVLSEETKLRISNSRKDKKSVICVETNIVYDSIANASKMTGAPKTSITRACKNLKGTSGGYHWRFTNQSNLDIKVEMEK